MKWLITDIHDAEGIDDIDVSPTLALVKLYETSKSNPDKTYGLYGNKKLRLRIKDGVVTENRPDLGAYYSGTSRPYWVDAYHWTMVLELSVDNLDTHLVERMARTMSSDTNDLFLAGYFNQVQESMDRKVATQVALEVMHREFDSQYPSYDANLKKE